MKFLIVLLWGLSCSIHFAIAESGSSGTRSGGDFAESSIYDIGIEVITLLAKSQDPKVQTAANKMKQTLSCLKVEILADPHFVLDGRTITAMNYPDMCKIVLSRPSWEKSSSDSDRVRLVIHELLGLAKESDPQYAVSKKMTEEYFSLKKGSPPNSPTHLYKNSGEFLVPDKVKEIRVLVVGGGGGGGGGHLSKGSGGGGGAGGGVIAAILQVKPGSRHKIVVGDGGAGASGGGLNGQPGELSSFSTLLLAKGGGGGYSGHTKHAKQAHGGSGGGSGGGGGGNGAFNTCSGSGGISGSNGGAGLITENEGLGGKGEAWSSLVGIVLDLPIAPGPGGSCKGSSEIFNGGGGGGGLVLNNEVILGASGTSTGAYGGSGGSGGTGYGAGGGGGTGRNGKGGDGVPGVVYIEW